MGDTATKPTDCRNRFFAWIYPKIARHEEARGGAEHRHELLAGLSGRVVEVGAGIGLNFSYYPGMVDEVVAVEPEVKLRGAAEEAATSAAVKVSVVPGMADDLPLEDASFDAAVLSLVLCSLPDVAAGLAEVRRVLKPGGEVRFYEHVRSNRPMGAAVQRAVDVVWPHLGGGCHLSRNTEAALERADFEVRSIRRFSFVGAPHIIGVATV